MSKRHTYQSYTSPRLRYALCDPDGLPFMVAHNPALCLGWYVDMRGGLILDGVNEQWWYESMLNRKVRGRSWTIRHITTTVLVGDVLGDIKQFRRYQREEEKQDRNDETTRTKKGKGGQAAEPKREGGPPSRRKTKAKARTARRRAAAT